MGKAASIPLLPLLYAGIAALLFGLATPASKILLNNTNPFLLAGLLYLGASIGLFPFVLAKRGFFFFLGLNWANRLRLFGAITLGGIIGPLLLLFGLQKASASSVSLWLNFELVATTVLGFLFFRDYVSGRGWTGVLLALFSGVMLTMHEGMSGLLAALLVCLACLCWGMDNHLTALIDGISAIQSTFLKGLFAGSINTLIGVNLPHDPLSINGVLPALLLGTVSYGASIVLYILSAQRLGAIRSQIIFSSAPFFGVLFSMVLLSETMTLLQLASFFLLVIAISIMAYDRHAHSHTHEALEHTHYHGHDDLHHEHAHDDVTSYHEHPHTHVKNEHTHPHWPDLHHRHEHE